MSDQVAFPIGQKYGLELTQLNVILANFKEYIKENEIKTYNLLLRDRKSCYKKYIKKTKLKHKLRQNLALIVKNPVRLVFELLSDKIIKRNFSKFLNEKMPVPIYCGNSFLPTNNTGIPWTKEEERLLERNIKGYCKQYGIDDIGNFLMDKSRDAIKLKRETNFINRMGNNFITRTPKQAYLHIYSLKRKYRKRGRWGKTEEDMLAKLHGVHGNKWTIIGEELGRDPLACCRKFAKLNIENLQSKKSGKWSRKELKRLRRTVCKIMKVPKGTLIYKNIPWKIVCGKMKTRSAQDCCEKWCYSFCWKKEFDRRCSLKKSNIPEILNILKSKQYQILRDIDWEEVWKEFDNGDTIPTPVALKTKFYSLCRFYSAICARPGVYVDTLIEKCRSVFQSDVPLLSSSSDDDF